MAGFQILRVGYRSAVAWIAGNDDEDLGNDDTGYILTVLLVADLWGKEPQKVAEDIVAYRSKK